MASTKQTVNTEVQQQVYDKIQKLKANYDRHIQAIIKVSSGVLIKLKPKREYEGFQSRPDLKIGLSIDPALKNVDESLYRPVHKQSTETEGILIELRPFDRDRTGEVL